MFGELNVVIHERVLKSTWHVRFVEMLDITIITSNSATTSTHL